MSSLTAPNNYQVGEVIYDGKPFIRVIRHDLWDKVCANCLKSDCHLKRCGACGITKYCEKLCQKNAWKDHKWECPYLRNYTDFRQQELVQMIGNIILKINGRDWKTVTERILDTEVSFDELMSHADDAPELNLIVNLLEIKDLLMSYIGRKNIPDDATLIQLLGKVLYNRFGFKRGGSVSEMKDGSCLLIGASKFDHSCVPNSVVKCNGTSISFRAIKPIHKSEKITFSYCLMIENIRSSIDYELLKRSFKRDCYCSDCSQPYGQSALTKIIDKSKALSVLQDTKWTLEGIAKTSTTFHEKLFFLPLLKHLLQEQEGVLGHTNLYRMRTLAWCCLFMDGPGEEMRYELKQLADAMVEVRGENFLELKSVYRKLYRVDMDLGKHEEAIMYAKKLYQLRSVCLGYVYSYQDFLADMLSDALLRNLVM